MKPKHSVAHNRAKCTNPGLGREYQGGSMTSLSHLFRTRLGKVFNFTPTAIKADVILAASKDLVIDIRQVQ